MSKPVDNPFADLEELVVPEPKPLDERLGGASASVDKLCDDSVVKALLRLPPEERAAFVRDVPEEAIQLIGYSWQDWARKEQLPPPGKWGTWLILAGRGMGKMASLDTEIPTASGWKTFGTVEVGDQLWDERGQPCTVTALHPINETPESYRVTFTGGATVDCCADHLWTVVTDADCRRLDALRVADRWGTSPRAAVVPTRALLGRPQYAGGCDAFVYTGEWRQILSIASIPPVPMRCITVDSPSGLFLITRHYIPTHNTRSGAEFIRAKVAAGAKRIALVGRTAGDVRDTMIFGESGIMAVTPPAERPRYIRADRALIWPNGAHALLATAMEPDILRGPQFEVGWSDELASWFYPETWDNLMMCMRLGANPQVVTTTTPRPTDLIRSLVRDSTVVVTRGSTYDNAGNLPEAYITRMTEKYAGTRLGKQELYAEILDDTSGALWKMTDIPHIHQVPERLVRVITGVDPTVQAQGRGDDVGIVTVGVGESGRLYVLADDSGQMSPSMWAETAIRAANRWGSHLIVAEGNQGGDLVRTNIIAAPLLSPDRLGIPGLKQVVIPPIDIVHARVGKVARAEPVVSLYQQRRVVHVGQHAALEDQMTTWIPDVNARSPGRIDALVWAGTYVIDLVRSQSAPSRGKVMPFLVPNTPDRGAY